VLALLGWAVLHWLPNDEKAIRSLMRRLTQAASVKPNESSFARLAYVDRLAGFFTTNVTMQIEGFGTEFTTIQGRTDLIQAAMAARTQLRQASFKVSDLDIKFPPEKRTAHAYVVITGHINFETNHIGQAFKMSLNKTGGRWLISQVRSVEN
jgi:hypothetical protein